MHDLILAAFLFTLVSCEDVASNNRRSPPTSQAPTTTAVSALEVNSVITSGLHREKGTPVLSYAEEIKKLLASDLSDKIYRTIPLIEKDDEGSAKNLITVDDLGRPSTDCGQDAAFKGITERIADCEKKNEASAVWEGKSYGASGEGTWKLVLKTGTSEAWLDERTGMVWSHVLASTNWCKASGNSQQNMAGIAFNCLEIGKLESACSISDLQLLGEFVKWRLPTRNDFLQADLNGLRFVLKKEKETDGLWTATIRSLAENRSEAWIYNSKEGTLTAANLDSEHGVRCIGVPVK